MDFLWLHVIKVGLKEWRRRDFLGKSCILSPMGEAVIKVGLTAISTTIDLSQIYTHNISHYYYERQKA